jgi:MOSC domain-containing protein YiiM
MMEPHVEALHLSPLHGFSKERRARLTLLRGEGITGDAHCGATVQHRSRVAANPAQPNLRQVHLLHGEMIDEMNREGFGFGPGDVGENITTRGIDVLALPRHALLHIGPDVILCVTGLRNPCTQIDAFRPGLTQAFLGRAPDGALIRKAGIMAIVLEGGDIAMGDAIRVHAPALPHRPLERV